MARLDELLTPDELNQMLSLKSSLPAQETPEAIASDAEATPEAAASKKQQAAQDVMDQGIAGVKQPSGTLSQMPSSYDTSMLNGILPPTQSTDSLMALMSAPSIPTPTEAPAKATTTRAPAKESTEDKDEEEEKPDYLKNLIAQLQGQVSGGPEQLRAAQDAQRQISGLAGMGMAGQQLGAALSRGAIKPDYTAQEAMMKQGAMPVENVMKQQAMLSEKMKQGLQLSDLMDKDEQRDPDSLLSQSMRATAKLNGVKVPEDASYEQIIKSAPILDTALKTQMMGAYRQQQMELKQKTALDKNESDFTKDIASVRRRGAANIAENGILAADRVLDLFKSHPDPSSWDKDQVHLFRTETEKLATGGIPSRGGVAGLIPDTVSSTLLNGVSRVTGDTIGTDQGNYVKQLLPYINNVRDTSVGFVRSNLAPSVAAYKNKTRPEDFQRIMEGVNDKVNYFPEYSKAPATGSTAPAAKAYPEGTEATQDGIKYIFTNGNWKQI
jgi:hypothetical protein